MRHKCIAMRQTTNIDIIAICIWAIEKCFLGNEMSIPAFRELREI